MDLDVNNFAPNIPIKQDSEALNIQESFRKFLEEYVDLQSKRKPYIDEIKDLQQPERNTLTVSFPHLEDFNGDLAQLIIQAYYRMYPYLCRAVQHLAVDMEVKIGSKELYVAFDQVPTRHKVRELTAEKVGTLIRISGQVVRTHPVHPELCKGHFICEDCNTPVRNVEQQFKYTQPTKCANPACQNRVKFQLDVHKSLFVDFQKVRIQETQAELPRGSIPRSVEVIMRGEAVEVAQPGDRCDFTGTLIVVPDVSQLAIPGARAERSSRHRGQEGYDADGLRGLKALGVRDLNYKLAFLACSVSATNPRFGGKDYSHDDMVAEDLWGRMTKEEQKQIKKMSEDKILSQNLIDSLFPAIYGSEEVKRGVMLMLFGGVPKKTSEGTTLRGDVNVCIVGDPSTAKSQVLKQVEEFSPRAVYTSGKASSAAGLTAAVVKDEESFEFVIEAGALMLADNGVCCIDEFDKMDPKDQVAIHEAMEQQTISLTKAGVKATLNARTSILAAANPIGGRYDRARSLRQNISLSAPIMSRFDLFFVLLDECSETIDYAIARKILDVHRNLDKATNRVYSVEDIQRYILFARCFKPKIKEDAGRTLVEEYKRLRLRDSSGAAVSSWRITVRQLESMIRLSEALARMQLKEFVEPGHVKEACRLLNKSIVRVEQPDIHLEEDQEMLDAVAQQEAQQQQPMETDQQHTEENGSVAGESVASEGKQRKLILSFEEYKHIANALVLLLRREEERHEDESGDPGMKECDLVSKYLEQIEEQLETEQQLIEKKNIVEKVIKRLITHDHILIALSVTRTESGSMVVEGDEDDAILVVHPNYVMEDE